MAWTPITADTSWQDLLIAGQIGYAFDRRVLALSESERTTAGVALLFEDRDPSEDETVFDVVYALQSGIEAMYWLFSDPSGPVTSASAGHPYLSLPAFQAVSGLTQAGLWRRIAAGGSQPAAWPAYGAAGWAYGKIQDGDLAGPWLWIDIQNALGALKRRSFGGGFGDYADVSVRIDLPFQTATQPTFQPGTAIPFNASAPAPAQMGRSYQMAAWKQLRNVPLGGGAYARYWDLGVGASEYCTIYVSGLGGLPKTASLVGVAYFEHININDPAWAGSGFGTGWPEYGKPGWDDFRVLASASGTADAFQKTLPDAMTSDWANWGDFLAYIPWPTPTLPVQVETKRRLGAIEVYPTHLVVDYDFDP